MSEKSWYQCYQCRGNYAGKPGKHSFPIKIDNQTTTSEVYLCPACAANIEELPTSYAYHQKETTL